MQNPPYPETSTSREMAGAGTRPDGTQEQPILIDDDQDIPQFGIGFEVEKLVRQIRKGDARFDPINLDSEDDNFSEDPWRADEDSYDNDNAKIEREELANEPEDTQDRPCVHWKKAVRNPCPCGTHQKVPKMTIRNMELRESQVVELNEPVRVGRYGAEFVEVQEIWVPNKGDDIFIRGRTYARTRNLEGRIEPRKNEVCEIYELDENDHRVTDPTRHLEQALVEIPVRDIKTVRKLHKTNKAFPECRFDRVRYRTKEERENEAPLSCRWEMVLSYPDPRYRRQQRPIAGELIRHYNQDDIPKDRHRISDSERLKAHEKIRGGSFIPNGAPKVSTGASPIHKAQGQKYTVVDIFSGAGGYSKGAEMAGVKVLAACDHWPRCCDTYRRNFPDTELHQEDVYEFIDDMSTDLTREHLNADILHFSPPCQTWSPAHTCEGKKDEENRATLFACEKIITIFKPRIFTVEQTFGLAQERWIPNFNALIQGFTRHGYSVKWKVLHLVEYGLPQTRKRLVMIGAAPGEQLPAWPRPTHSKDPKDGQKPFVSAFEACSSLVDGENLHDVEGARPTNKAPWDSNKPLGRTITTSGGQSYHHSGLREYTLGEFAVLQGFPVSFQFVGKCIKKQIGNAFAPIVVKTLLKCIRIHLEKFDGVTRQPPHGQVIIVSDDEDDDLQSKRPQLQHKDYGKIQDEGQSVVEDLVGFGRKPSAVGQELLHGLIEGSRKNSVQWFTAKESKKSLERHSSSGPSLQKSSRVSNSQTRPVQRNTTDSDFVLGNHQDSPTAASTVFIGGTNVIFKSTADSGTDSGGDLGADPRLTAPQGDNTVARDVTAATSGTTFQISSTAHLGKAVQSNNILRPMSRHIHHRIISAPPCLGLDTPQDCQSAQLTMADESSSSSSSARRVDTSTSNPLTGQGRLPTIVGGVLIAPSRPPSDPDIALPATHRSASTARTIATIHQGPPQTRSSFTHPEVRHSAENSRTLAGLGQPSSASHPSLSGNVTVRQPRQTRQIIDGVLMAPRRQSPPGFWDRLIPDRDVEVIPQSPATQASQRQEEHTTAAPVPPYMAAAQAIRAVSETASLSSLFHGLVEDLQGRPPVTLAAPAQIARQNTNITGVFQARRGRSGTEPATAIGSVETNEGTNFAGVQSTPVSRLVPLRQEGPVHQNSRFGGSVGSSANETSVRATLRRSSQGIQTGDGAPGSSRVRSSGDSNSYTGESCREGDRQSLPITIKDYVIEEAGGSEDHHGPSDEGAADNTSNVEVADDRDEQLQHALWESRAGAPAIEKAARETIADRRQSALKLQRQMLAKYRPTQNNAADDTDDGGDDDDDAPAPDMYGPGDSKGEGKEVGHKGKGKEVDSKDKGKEVATRKFDDFDDDDEAEDHGKQNKRPRGCE